MQEIFDSYSWTKENKTITHDRHHVPGLGNFSFFNYTAAPAYKPMHYHSNIFEFHCMVRGMRTTQVKELDTGMVKTYTYTGNQVFLTLPFEPHGGTPEAESSSTYFAFQLNISDQNALLGLNRVYSNLLYKQLTSLPARQFQLGNSHIGYLRSAFNFFSEQSPESIAVGVQFLSTFLFSLSFLPPVEEVQKRRIDNRIHRSIEYLRANLSEPVTIDNLALAAGYSVSHFKTKFHAETGITPAEYIMMMKMGRARELLIQNNCSITEIAYSLGFSSSNYFSTVFHKYYGLTPREYRARRQS